MFRAIILSIFRSTKLYVTACGCIIPQAVTHSLVLLKMGKIIARNMLSWLELKLMEILTSVKRLDIRFKSLVNDFVYSFGRAALLLLVEV